MKNLLFFAIIALGIFTGCETPNGSSRDPASLFHWGNKAKDMGKTLKVIRLLCQDNGSFDMVISNSKGLIIKQNVTVAHGRLQGASGEYSYPLISRTPQSRVHYDIISYGRYYNYSYSEGGYVDVTKRVQREKYNGYYSEPAYNSRSSHDYYSEPSHNPDPPHTTSSHSHTNPERGGAKFYTTYGAKNKLNSIKTVAKDGSETNVSNGSINGHRHGKHENIANRFKSFQKLTKKAKDCCGETGKKHKKCLKKHNPQRSNEDWRDDEQPQGTLQ